MSPQSESKQRRVLGAQPPPLLLVYLGPACEMGHSAYLLGISSSSKPSENTPEKCPEALSLGDSKCCQVDRINHPRSLNVLNGKNIKWVNSIDYKSHICEFDFKTKEMVVKSELLKKQLRHFLIHQVLIPSFSWKTYFSIVVINYHDKQNRNDRVYFGPSKPRPSMCSGCRKAHP